MWRALCGWMLASLLASPWVFAAENDSSPARGRTLLLADEHDILYRSGTRRVFTPATRRATKPLVPQTKLYEVAIGWTSIHRDPTSGKYQLWYQAYAGRRAGDKRLQCLVCYAESDDGLEFRKPELGLIPFKDDQRTNIVLDGNGGYGDRYCNSVLVDPREPNPARRYKMAYYDWSQRDGREYPGLHVAFSPDGIRWTKHPEGSLYLTSYGNRGLQPPLGDGDVYHESPYKGATRKVWNLPQVMADAVDVMYDPQRGVFAIYGKMWMDGPSGTAAWKHGLGRIESRDFLTWNEPQFLLGPDEHDHPDTEFHTSPVFYYHGRYFCLNQLFNRRLKGAIDIELMTSRDGLTWERNFRDERFLARSEPGLFDSRSIFTNATPVFLADEIRFYYGAYNQSPLGGVKSAVGERSGVGMASIALDRFAGIATLPESAQVTLRQPLQDIGQVTFKPLDLTGCRRLQLNAAAESGVVQAELLDERGFRVPGFTRDDCEPLTGDSLRHTVAWRNTSLSNLPAGRYQLRVHLQRATLYAVSFE